ncbi:MAG: serine protease [Oligoflexia bacterium]|nr:MAG: serine protease [Oligoflexia bacterium]
MKNKLTVLYLFFYLLANFFSSELWALEAVKADNHYKIKKIIALHWTGPITPATYQYIQEGLKKVSQDSALLISMNTPGGLVSTTKDILTLFGESQVPIIVWVNPEGASATSAGAIISAGAHVLLMSEGSNIGAATPVQITGDLEKEKSTDKSTEKSGEKTEMVKDAGLREKAVNDLVALVKSLALARGRNSEKFADMISKASSFPAREALQENLIDAIANTRAEVEMKTHQRQVSIKGQALTLQVDSPVWIDFEMSVGEKWLNVLAHPSLAYVLFLIGAALIYFELQAPGGLIAGSIGAICLLLSGIGFQVLPLNYGAFGLILLSFVLFFLEIYITSYGLLTLAGLAGLITGSLFIFHTNDAYLSLSYSIIGAAVASIAVFLLLVFYVLIRDRKVKHKDLFKEQVGREAVVVNILDHSEGRYWVLVKVGGEMWKATSRHPHRIGDHVVIKEKSEEGLHLIILDKES